MASQLAPPRPAPSTGPVTLAELSHLWWFADGAIMDAGTREHLHRAWGLCTRHAWLYFRVETELRVDPLGNAVLLADLVACAAKAVRRRPERRVVSALTTTECCLTCDHLAGGTSGSRRFAGQLREVNVGTATADWCLACHDIWDVRRCPSCSGRRAGSGIFCRVHAIEFGRARDQRGSPSWRVGCCVVRSR